MAIFGQCLATFLFHHLVTLSVTQSKGDRIDSQIIFSNKKLIQQIILALPLRYAVLVYILLRYLQTAVVMIALLSGHFRSLFLFFVVFSILQCKKLS